MPDGEKREDVLRAMGRRKVPVPPKVKGVQAGITAPPGWRTMVGQIPRPGMRMGEEPGGQEAIGGEPIGEQRFIQRGFTGRIPGIGEWGQGNIIEVGRAVTVPPRPRLSSADRERMAEEGQMEFRGKPLTEEEKAGGPFIPTQGPTLGAEGTAGAEGAGVTEEGAKPFRVGVDIPTTEEQALATLSWTDPQFGGLGIEPETGQVIEEVNGVKAVVTGARASDFLRYNQFKAIAEDIRVEKREDRQNKVLADIQVEGEKAINAATDEAEKERLKLRIQADIDAATLGNQREWELEQQRNVNEENLQRSRLASEEARATLDRAITQGNLDEVVRANQELERLRGEEMSIQQSQFKIGALMTMFANPAMMFFARQSGMLASLTEGIDVDLSLFGGGGEGGGQIPFTGEDLARMTPSQRTAAIASYSASTGMTEEQILQEIGRRGPGRARVSVGRTTL